MQATLQTNQNINPRWKATFFTIWIGQAFSLLGSSLVGFALIWWMTETTGSATILATATMLEYLPRIFIGPIAGTLVDRWNRRVVMISADALTAVATLVLIVLVWAGNLQIWQLFVLMLVRSSAGAFHMPAMFSSTSLMVPEEQLTRIQGLNQLLTGLMNIIAPILGALLIELIPLHGVLAVDLVTAALAILPLLFISIPQPERSADKIMQQNSVWDDLRQGLRYVWGWAGLRNIILLAVFINMISTPAIALMPLLVKNVFSGGAIQIAAMQSSWAVGFLIGGLLLSIWGGFKRKILTATLAMFGTAVGMLMVGVSHSIGFQLAIAGIFIAGMMNVLMNGPAFALLQTVVDADMQGRVLSLVISLAGAMAPVGLIVAGPLADQIGVSALFLFSSIIFVLSGVFTVINSDLRNIENSRKESTYQHEPQAQAVSPTV